MRDFHFPGRSPVIATEGMAATSHPLATLAAIETLRAGGNAADAAVTACATLCIVEPHMTGIGGDCFAIVAPAGKPLWGYNGSGRSAAAASLEEMTAANGSEIAPYSAHALTVPGAIDAWEAILKAHGRFDLARALAPAIHYAERGFPVAARVAYDWAQHVPRLLSNAGAAKHYLFGGKPPAEGDVIRFPALAQTLKTIAAKGARAFYEGEIAADIVATAKAGGSKLAESDFAAHRGEPQTPIKTAYRGIELVELPPNGQGIVAMMMLNILENFEMSKLDPLGPERFHLLVEAARLAYAARDAHVADLPHMKVSIEALLDKKFAKSLAAKIDRSKRVPLPKAPTPSGSDTVYLSVVDRDRMAVSFINSLFHSFGTGIATEKTGILLTNRGAGFNLTPGHPNAFAPGKRPIHTIIPAMTQKAGRCDMSLGVMGRHFQSMGHVQLVLNTVDYKMDIQSAIDAPRLFFDGDKTVVERSMPEATNAGLKARGHDVSVAALPWGGAQAIKIDWQRGVLIAGSEPRKDGCALGY